MKKSVFPLLALSLLVLLFTSCRKEPLERVNPNNRKCKTYLQQFETVWQGMDQGYVFWEKDSVNWDDRYEKYKPIFEAFDARPANKPVTAREYAEAYQGLFEGLLDHHLTGRFYSPKGNFETWVSPGRNDYSHTTTSAYERQLQVNILRDRAVPGTYVGFNPTTTSDGLVVPGSYTCLIEGTKPHEYIAYFRFTNFYFVQLASNHHRISNWYSAELPVKAFYGPQYYNGMITGAGYANSDSVVSLIIDLRGNTGGSVADLAPLIGSLSQSRTLVGYTRVKDGFGRLDYSPWTESYVECPSMHLNKPKPIVVLADINSVSCAELATMLIKSLPNGTFIGERTYGAIGGLYSGEATNIYHDLFYGGCFGDYEYFNNGPDPYVDVFSYYVYTSTFHMVDANYNDVEGFGVQPDIQLGYSRNSLEAGRDAALNRAIMYLHQLDQ